MAPRQRRLRLGLPHPRVRAWSAVLLAALAVPAAATAAPAAHRTAAPAAHRIASAPAPVQRATAAPAQTTRPATALAESVALVTGRPSAEIAAADVCPPPAAGQAQCGAQLLVVRSTGARVRPAVADHATFTQVFPANALLRRAESASSGAAPPQPGTPAYLQQAYDLTYLSQVNGGGDTVAVVDAYDDPNAESDLATYRSTYGLPPCTTANGCFRKVNAEGAAAPLPAPDGTWEAEESLDLDAASALCPNCRLLLVESASADAASLEQGIDAAQALGADQISNSWGSVSSSPGEPASFGTATVIAGTGDAGYPGAGQDVYPAALSTVTAVGGTTLVPATTASNLRGFSESAWSLSADGVGGGSGCDLSEPKPAYQTDTGCTGRAYADVSADADPDTGLTIYDSADGGWLVGGGTSLATPLVAAFEAVTGIDGATPQWAYTDGRLLNDPSTGTDGSCAAAIFYICNAGIGYDGPTGMGSISGDVAAGAPGIGGPAIGSGSSNSYTETVGATTAALAGGVYPNGLATTAFWQYGTSTAYGQTTPAAPIGAGPGVTAAAATLTGLTPGTVYHYRLVAQNADGTSYGYDYTLTTTASTVISPARIASAAPPRPHVSFWARRLGRDRLVIGVRAKPSGDLLLVRVGPAGHAVHRTRGARVVVLGTSARLSVVWTALQPQAGSPTRWVRVRVR